MFKKALLLVSTVLLMLSLTCCAFLPLPDAGDKKDPVDKTADKLALVYPDMEEYNPSMTAALGFLENAYANDDGSMPMVHSDRRAKGEGEREIILGSSDRPLSAEAKAALPTDDTAGLLVFSIVSKDGDIAVCGKTETAMIYGVRWLIKNYPDGMDTDKSFVKFSTEGEYAFSQGDAEAYDIDKLPSFAALNSVTVGGTLFEGFNPAVSTYDIALSVRAQLPELDFTCPGMMSAVTTQATEDSYRATVKVTAKNGTDTRSYTFNFKRNEFDVMDAYIEKVYGGRAATVVIVHDDGTHETVDYMVKEFVDNGLVGTLGLITKNLASKNSAGNWILNTSEVNYWKGVLKKGVFDVASHSHTHSFWGITDEAESGWYLDSGGNLNEYSLPAGNITLEVAGSQEVLRMAFPDQDVLAFIKPGFGRVSDSQGTTGLTQISDKAFEIIGEYYIGMRNTGGGVDTIPPADVYSIKSHTVKAEDTSATWQGQVNTAIDTNGMLVFLFHTIKDNPTGLAANKAETGDFFSWLGDKSADGSVWNTHLEDAILYSEEYKYSKLSVIDRGDKIEVDLTHNLGDVYSHELTVRVPIPTDSETVSVTFADGRTAEYQVESDNESRYLLIDIVPNSGTVTVNN